MTLPQKSRKMIHECLTLRLVRIILVVFLLPVVPLTVYAIDPPVLLNELPVAVKSHSLTGSAKVTVDLSLIAPGKDAPAVMKAVLPGREVLLRRDRMRLRGGDNYTWQGKVIGDDLSTAVMTFRDGVLYGSVETGDDRYSILPEDEHYRVVRHDAAAEVIDPDDFRVPPIPSDASGGSGALSLHAVPEDGSRIDVLVLYTQQMLGTYGSALGAKIQHFVDLANAALSNSGVPTELRLAGTELYTSASVREGISIQNALDYLTCARVPCQWPPSPPSLVASWRDSYKADLVSLLRVYPGSGTSCGIGWLMQNVSSSFAGYAFSVVEVRDAGQGGYYCDERTLAHEIGHNMGCAHDRANASVPGAFSYSYGYTANGLFSTLMAYPPAGTPRITYFSTPFRKYPDTVSGWPIGVNAGQPGEAFNALSITNTRVTLSNFRLAELKRLSVSMGGGGNGSVTSMPQGIDCGASCEAFFTEGQTVTLYALPDNDSLFAGWSGAGCSGTGNCVLTMSGDRSVTVAFDRAMADVTVTKTGGGTGTVTSNPAGITCGGDCTGSYTLGTSVTITATPDADSLFLGWSSCDSVSGTECGIIVSGSRAIEASFAPRTVNGSGISVSPGGHGFGGINRGSTSGEAFFTISNTGGTVLQVNSIALTGGDMSSFLVSPGRVSPCTLTGQLLSAGNSCSVGVRFVPASPGGKSAVLTISSNDFSAPVLDLQLQGTGVITPVFQDVPAGVFAEDFINTVFYNGITAGCSEDNYCPDEWVTRAQMAVFILKSMVSAGLLQSDFSFPETPYFLDVLPGHWAFRFVQKMKEIDITGGCSGTSFCPDDPVTRGQMAVFIMKALGEAASASCSGSFIDVNTATGGNPAFCKYIEKFATLGITSGCGDGTTYCPDDAVTRGQMAVFLTEGFLY